jgi:hypothetical protein
MKIKENGDYSESLSAILTLRFQTTFENTIMRLERPPPPTTPRLES